LREADEKATKNVALVKRAREKAEKIEAAKQEAE